MGEQLKVHGLAGLGGSGLVSWKEWWRRKGGGVSVSSWPAKGGRSPLERYYKVNKTTNIKNSNKIK